MTTTVVARVLRAFECALPGAKVPDPPLRPSTAHECDNGRWHERSGTSRNATHAGKPCRQMGDSPLNRPLCTSAATCSIVTGPTFPSGVLQYHPEAAEAEAATFAPSFPLMPPGPGVAPKSAGRRPAAAQLFRSCETSSNWANCRRSRSPMSCDHVNGPRTRPFDLTNQHSESLATIIGSLGESSAPTRKPRRIWAGLR